MQFGVINVFVRWLFTLGLMFGFYNPSGRSFVHWAVEGTAPLSIRLFVGCLVVTAFLVLAGATVRSLGYPGLAVLSIVLVVLTGTIMELGLIDLESGAQVIVTLQAVIATGLTIGLSWSALRARLSGQVDSDDVSRRI